VQGVYERAKAYAGPDPTLPPDKRQAERVKAQRRFEQELWLLCEPYVKRDVPMRVLCERIERFLPELFVFVADPRVPADNNAAERSLRGQVVSRKISGGTRSDQGSETKSVLASLFGTWQLQGRNLYAQVRQLLVGATDPATKAVSAPSPPG
jgi:transposase